MMAGYKTARDARKIDLQSVRGAGLHAQVEPINGERARHGTSHIIALALAVLNLRVVHRQTLRALLPTGVRNTHNSDASVVAARISRGARPTAKDNNVTYRFQQALWRFEQDGLIGRGQDFVLVRNARRLFDWAMSVDWPEQVSIEFTTAIKEVERALRDDAMPMGVLEQRRQELIRLKALMEEGFGQHWSGRGSVRFVPRGRVL